MGIVVFHEFKRSDTSEKGVLYYTSDHIILGDYLIKEKKFYKDSKYHFVLTSAFTVTFFEDCFCATTKPWIVLLKTSIVI